MDVREALSLTVAGGVLPVGTVLGVLSLTARTELPWVVPLFLLLASPLFAAAGLYVAGIRLGALQTPSWLPVGTRRTFGNDIADRYHEEFSHETLGETTGKTAGGAAGEEGGTTGRLLALCLVYLISIPVYTLVLQALFG